MKCVGVTAEYNPFHNGHAYQIREAKRLTGADACIAVLSGSFVQRGEPACMNKFVRSRDAILGGADLVIELPDLLSCACAERFSGGAIRLLASTGIVEYVAFGSESGDIGLISDAAAAELSGEKLKDLLREGCSYPKAVSMLLGENGAALGPNDLLGVEYLRAIARFAPGLEAFAVKRIGSGYSSDELSGEFASAGAIRKAWAEHRFDDIRPYIPEREYESISDEAASPAVLENLSGPILYALRSIGRDGIKALAEVSEGLENPIYEAALRSSGTAELLERVKTKRYTMARLKRILINALLNATEEFQKIAANDPNSLYIRVLAVRRDRANELLSALSANARLPVVTAAVDAAQLNGTAWSVFEHSCLAQRIHALAFDKDRSAVSDFPSSIVVD